MKPSVTNLVDLLDKPALVRWANKLGLAGTKIDDYKSTAKESGSDIHQDIENYLKFNLLPEDDGLSLKITSFFKDKEILEVEKTVETEYFIGRFDVKLKWKDIIFICDFKSSKGVYLETKLQLAAYKLAEHCDHVAVIHVPDFLIRPVDLNQNHADFIITLSKLYELKQKIENGK